jgi:sugar O-acyltransferase (sialic acid O-acetyltransferase NeuD family)
MKKDVVIFGDGDFAKVAAVYLAKDSPYQVVAYTVNEAFLKQKEFRGRPLVPFESLERTYPPEQFAMFVAIGFSRVNRARAEVYGACKARGYEMIRYISSKAVQWGEIEVGDNCFVFENNVIQPFVKIGNDVILWSGNHIGHDAVIEDHCFVASHAVISGNCRIGEYSFVGVNATLRDGVVIGPKCVIGAGALIVKDTEREGVYKGVASERAAVPSNRLRGL